MEDDQEASVDECVNDGHSFLDTELEALKSIYIDELKVETNLKFTEISIDLYPATADNLDEQYVRMTLQFLLNKEYPEDIPDIEIKNPRGLSEEELNNIMEDLISIAEEKRNSSMLFEIIEAAKEHLTVGNRPSGECAICLFGFEENDVFTKTKCYHYFHSHCLARHAEKFAEQSEDYETDPKSKAISNELLCPMCRLPIEFHSEGDYPPPEASVENKFVLTEDVKELQKNMAELFKKQVEKGGIIDIEAEKNKYMLEISNVPTRPATEEKKQVDQLKSQDASSDLDTESAPEQIEAVESPVKQRKAYGGQNRMQDHRGRNRPYSRYNDSRENYRYNGRYNRPYNDFHGNYNPNKYDRYPYQKYDRYNEKYRRYSRDAKEGSENVEKESDIKNDEDASCPELENDNADVQEVAQNKQKLTPDRRYNRDYNNFRSRYRGGMRSDKISERNNEDRQRRRFDSGSDKRTNYGDKKYNFRSENYHNSRYSDDRRTNNTSKTDEQGFNISNQHEMEKKKAFNNDRGQNRFDSGSGRRTNYSDKKYDYRSDNYRKNSRYDGDRQTDNTLKSDEQGFISDQQDLEEKKEVDNDISESLITSKKSDDNDNPRHRWSAESQSDVKESENKSVVEDDEKCEVNNECKKDRTSEYDASKSNYRQNFDYRSSNRYSDRNSQKEVLHKFDTEFDEECRTDRQHRKYRESDYDTRKSNYRENFNYNSSDRYAGRNSRRETNSTKDSDGDRRNMSECKKDRRVDYDRKPSYRQNFNYNSSDRYRNSQRETHYPQDAEDEHKVDDNYKKDQKPGYDNRKPNYRQNFDYGSSDRYSNRNSQREMHTIPNAEDDEHRSDSDYMKNRRENYDNEKPNYRQNFDRNSSRGWSDRNSKKREVLNKYDTTDEQSTEGDYKKDRRIDFDKKFNYRQNFDYNFSDRNPQRGGRRGFGRRDNDSNFSGRNNYRDFDRGISYSERDRSYRGKDAFRGNQSRENYSRNGYRYKNGSRDDSSIHVEEPEIQPIEDNQESADLSSRSPSSDSNQLSIDLDNHEEEISSKKFLKEADSCKAEYEEIPVCDTDRIGSKPTLPEHKDGNEADIHPIKKEKPQGGFKNALQPPPGFANPLKKVIYGFEGANPPPGFNKS